MPIDPAFVWDTRPRFEPERPVASPPSAPTVLDAAAEPASAPAGAGRPDSVLVPLDQWTRLLNQLGNLHEAGQQLAEARERAAKAETETFFLRERIKEMRVRLEEAERLATPPATQPAPAPEPAPPFWSWAAQRLVERRRRPAREP
jgi:hypothetical protein